MLLNIIGSENFQVPSAKDFSCSNSVGGSVEMFRDRFG